MSCGLDSTGSFSFSWTDDAGTLHAETYEGLLGLTPHWKTGPLMGVDGQWISACLAARVNWYGLPVQLSIRGTNRTLKKPGDDELTLYTTREGAFWGDLFSGSPAVYACYEPSSADHARELHRDCAAGHLDPQGGVSGCGIIQIVGPCADVCQNPHLERGYYSMCGASGAPAHRSEAITVFLQ